MTTPQCNHGTDYPCNGNCKERPFSATEAALTQLATECRDLHERIDEALDLIQDMDDESLTQDIEDALRGRI